MNVLIIEDDPMVDFIHRNYLEKVNKFQIILSSDSISDALNKLDHYNIDLILLDIHIKEGNGIQFLENLRLKHHNCEVIIISAVNDGKIVKSGFHFGIVDYLIKPFTFERFESSITSFLDRKKQLNQHIINQNQIDKLKNGQNNKQKQDNIFLEKGLSEIHRVLRPGGKAIILELSNPTAFPVKQLYNFYFHKIVPAFGRMISKDSSAYSYLPESVAKFPDGERFAQITDKVGFASTIVKPQTFGFCTIYEASK